MKKQRFSGILALMAISLLGIILVQLFWIKKAISVREEQFNHQVNIALTNASYRIERNQNAFYISSFMSDVYNQLQHTDKLNNLTDSIILSLGNFYGNNSQKSIAVNPSNRQITKDKNGKAETITYLFDTIIETGQFSQRIQTYHSVTTPEQKLIEKEPQFAEANAFPEAPDNEVREELHNLMGQMLFEINIKDIPIEERIDFSVLGPTLAYELRNAGIFLPFEFAVVNDKGKANPKLSSKGFKSADKSHLFKTTLFPNEIVPHSEQLAIFFPDRLSFIYGAVVWLLIGSLLFTTIILITFFYTLRIIFNQKRVSEVKTDFINNMTHEFKTPIATIQLAADSIVNPTVINQPDRVQRFIQIIKEENRRMHRHVESVLQMSLLDKKDFNLNLQPVHVHPLIKQAVNNISLQVEQKGGSIKLDMMSENDFVKVDQAHFINVIYNLLDNANKYSIDKTPEITVSTSSVNGQLFISVSDKGVGMDKETQEKVFEKFYRHPMGDVHTVKGFGLGLSYAKAIILSCKGEIKINSQKGAGSTFTIQLPLLPDTND